MSYILDALRKSEERRKHKQRVQAPLETARIGSRSNRANKRRIGGLILTGCMLLAIILLGAGWWWASPDYIEVNDASENAATDTAIPKDIPATAMNQSGEIVVAANGSSSDAPIVKSPVAKPDEEQSPPSDEIIDLTDFPTDVQTRISDMKYSGHVYSPTPSLRMIMIDNVVVREGDRIAADLILAEITENGLIMQLDSTRFHMDLF